MSNDNEISKELLLELLGTLSKLRKDFPFTLLLHVLSAEDTMKLLEIFAGTNVTFPTQKELLECISFCIVHKYGEYEKAPKEITSGISKRRYNELLEALDR